MAEQMLTNEPVQDSSAGRLASAGSPRLDRGNRAGLGTDATEESPTPYTESDSTEKAEEPVRVKDLLRDMKGPRRTCRRTPKVIKREGQHGKKMQPPAEAGARWVTPAWQAKQDETWAAKAAQRAAETGNRACLNLAELSKRSEEHEAA
ncbi:unnamed protein product, partial [Prorocentrum cordatum]